MAGEPAPCLQFRVHRVQTVHMAGEPAPCLEFKVHTVEYRLHLCTLPTVQGSYCRLSVEYICTDYIFGWL